MHTTMPTDETLVMLNEVWDTMPDLFLHMQAAPTHPIMDRCFVDYASKVGLMHTMYTKKLLSEDMLQSLRMIHKLRFIISDWFTMFPHHIPHQADYSAERVRKMLHRALAGLEPVE